MTNESTHPTKSRDKGTAKGDFTTIVISRSNYNDTLEMFFAGKSVGQIKVELRRSAVRLTITAPPALRFIKGELSPEEKTVHQLKTLPLPGRLQQ